MAKWGEGDPRWIVEERPDAVNVNNWHWTEKNAFGWSQAKFKEIFDGYKILHDLFKMRITEVEKIEGEARANNRKGKLYFFYDWELTLKWKGKIKGSDEYVTGKMEIPNLGEENGLDEIEVNISVDQKSTETQTMKELLYAHSRDKIRDQLGKYIESLKSEFAHGMILPKRGDDNNATNSAVNNLTAGMETKMQMNASHNNSDKDSVKTAGNKLETANLEISQKFQCTSSELYNALTVSELVSAFTHDSVKLDLRAGGAFELFGGNITGEFVELVPGRRIVQKWRVKRWPAGIFSTVTMKFTQQSDHTELFLHQKGLPTSELESTRENWDRYYWEPIKRTFAFGSFL